MSKSLETIGRDAFIFCPVDLKPVYPFLLPALEDLFASDRSSALKQITIDQYAAAMQSNGKDKLSACVKENRLLFAERWLGDPDQHPKFFNLISLLVTKDNIDQLRKKAIEMNATDIASALLEYGKKFKSDRSIT